MGLSTTRTIVCDCCAFTFTEGSEPYDVITAFQSAPSYFCYNRGCNVHQRSAITTKLTSQSNAHKADVVTSIAAPTLPAVAAVASGGLFTAGTYYWKVTALTRAGETVGSAEVTVAIVAAGQATVTWTAVTGATGYRIYRSTTAGTYGALALAGAVTGQATATFTDTGAATTAGTVPATNTSGGIPVVTTPYA